MTSNGNILDRIALVLCPVCVVIMEVFWVYPWLVWAGRWEPLGASGAPLSLLGVAFLVTVSFIATRFLLSLSWSASATRWTMLVLGTLIVFIVIRLEYDDGIGLFSTRWFKDIWQVLAGSFSNLSGLVFALPASAYLWWRGMLLGRAREYSYVHSNLIFGAGSYVVLVIVWSATIGTGSLAGMVAAIAPAVAAFFFTGIIAMAFGNLRSVQKRMSPEEARSLSFGRWLPVVLGVTIGVVLVGILIATASSLDIAGFLKQVFGLLWGFFGKVIEYFLVVFQYILIPFEWLASLLLLFIAFIIRLLRGETPEPGVGEGGQAAEEIIELAGKTLSDDWLNTVKWLLFVVTVIIVTVIIARSIDKNRTRRRPEAEADYEEAHESLWSWRILFRDVLQFFRSILNRLFTRGRGVFFATGKTAGVQAEEPLTTLRIREIFRHLLKDASRAGISWRHSETPFEYARRFEEVMPEAAQQISELTELYVGVRYSTNDAGDHEVTHANSLWRNIRQILKKPEHRP
ncbi:MAG: DUF4129 domain-containing protein [Dehalococcoidia bacterium]|nr:DUF4129 domain-containing protein [Dehalococcoidia bacterium]